MDPYWLILIISLLFSAFFSGIEIAFYQANPLKIEIDKKAGIWASKLVSFFSDHSGQFITNTLIGNNLAIIIYGIVFTQLFTHENAGIFGITNPLFSFIVLTLTSTFIVLILAEFLPKIIFVSNPNKTLKNFIIPFFVIYIILFPLNLIISNISLGLMRILGYRIDNKKKTFDLHDLFSFVESSDNESENTSDTQLDTQILKNAIDLPNIKVRDCMIPRPEIVFIDISESVEQLKDLFVSSGHSKIIVVNDSIDFVVGYVHVVDLFFNPKTISEILRKIEFVPESMTINKLLKKFTSSNISIAQVIDEYGGTSGIISIEDVLEEIFGEINDEYDKDALKEVKVSDNEYILSARHEIDYLNEKYNLNLPEGDYSTLGGLVLEITQNFPQKGDLVHHENFTIKILSTSKNKIEEVMLTIH